MRDLLLLFLVGFTLLAVFRYPFLGLLLWAWFSIATPQAVVYSAGTLSLQIPIAIIATLALFVNGDFNRVRPSWQLFFIVCFGLWLCVAQAKSLDQRASLVAFDHFWKTMVFVGLCAMTITDRLRFTAMLWMLVLIMAFYGLRGFVFTAMTFGQYIYFGNDATILSDNNHLGIAMAAFLPMMMFMAIRATHKRTRMIMWAIVGMTGIAIIGTYSRGAFICLMVFGALYWWQSRRKLLIMTIALVMGIGALASAPDKYLNRIGTISEAAEDGSFLGRVDAWVINWELAVANPVTGAGPRAAYNQEVANLVSERTTRAAHSIYFEILGGTGFVGFLIYSGIWMTGLWSALRLAMDKGAAPWRRDFGKYVLMSLIIFGIGGASVSMEMWQGYLVLLVLARAARFMPDESSQTEAPTLSLQEKIKARAKVRFTNRGAPSSV